MGLRPVNSVKHIIETNGAIVAVAQSATPIVSVVNNPDLTTNPADCNVGSKVGSVYLRVEVVGTESAGGVDNIYMAVVKNPGANFVFPPLDQLGVSDLRKYVIHQEMIMLVPQSESGAGGGTARFPRTLFKGVIRIPKGYARSGINDRLLVLLQHRTGEVTQQTEFCLECIYKEFQ